MRGHLLYSGYLPWSRMHCHSQQYWETPWLTASALSSKWCPSIINDLISSKLHPLISKIIIAVHLHSLVRTQALNRGAGEGKREPGIHCLCMRLVSRRYEDLRKLNVVNVNRRQGRAGVVCQSGFGGQLSSQLPCVLAVCLLCGKETSKVSTPKLPPLARLGTGQGKKS